MRYLLIAAAIAILFQSSSAHALDQAAAAQAAMEQAIKAQGLKPSSRTTDKADAAMVPDSLPSESDKNAAAAMSK
jgi:hypothetical protein